MSNLAPVGANVQTVALTDIALELEIGIADWERVRGKAQQVLIDVEMAMRLDTFKGRSIDDCLDYDRVYRHVTQTLPRRGHTDLLETLAEDLVQFCFEDQRVTACRVRIRKPHVYNGRAVPSVTFTRYRAADED